MPNYYRNNYYSSYGYHKKSPFLPFTIFRLILTLILLVIFGIGVLSAFKYFSGYDPLELSPDGIAKATLSSPEAQKLISQVLGAKAPVVLGPVLSKYVISQNHPTDQILGTNSTESAVNKTLSLSFAIVSDSHNNNGGLSKALAQAKDHGIKFVIGLGDFTDVGTKSELEAAKKVLDNSGVPYYVTAGDHDLWNDRDKGMPADQTFQQVFGVPYKSFGYNNIRFLILYNSDNYLGADTYQMNWFTQELERVKTTHPQNIFVFVHEPLYHPSSDHFMGKTNPALQDQAKQLINLIKQAGVSEVFAGDIHYYTRYQDPESGLNMTTTGAITDQRNAQAPRFLLVDVYSDGSYNVEDTEIK